MTATPPPQVPFQDLPLQIRQLRAELDPAIDAVLRHGQFILGPEVAAFEQAWAQFCGTKHAIGVGSGTDALQLILRALGIGPATKSSPWPTASSRPPRPSPTPGAKPVLVDCSLDDYLIDPTAVAAAITPRTRAIMPVHLYGQPANMDALAALAQQHGLALIEDAAQAHGATLKDGRPCGALGQASALQLLPRKKSRRVRRRRRREHPRRRSRAANQTPAQLGLRREIPPRDPGLQFAPRYDAGRDPRRETQAHLAAWNERRARVAAGWYRAALAGSPRRHSCSAELAAWTGRHVYHLFVIRLLDHHRDTDGEISCRRAVSKPSCTTPCRSTCQKAYAELGYAEAGRFPQCRTGCAQSVLSLPMFPEMTRAQCDHVCERLRAALK
jgi:dTDP-3-amino-3,4,6-trideoxy-alpha-D-glucose transaminase